MHTLKLHDKDQSFNLNLFKCKKITLYEIMISLGNYIVRNQNKFTINQKCKAITKTVAEVSLFIHIECFEKTK